MKKKWELYTCWHQMLDSVYSSHKKACSLLKGVGSVKVVKSSVGNYDITKTKGFREAMDDIEKGRVYSAEDMFKQIVGSHGWKMGVPYFA